MPSDTIHTIINQLLCDRLPVIDPNAFLIGGVSPDAFSHLPDRSLRDQLHFTVRQYGKRHMDVEGFSAQYLTEKPADSFLLGYYIHLLEDQYWLDTVYKQYISSYPKEQQKDRLKAYYRDFPRLTTFLPQRFGVTVVPRTLDFCPLPLLAKEDADRVWAKVFPYLELPRDEHLELFALADIDRYIHNCGIRMEKALKPYLP